MLRWIAVVCLVFSPVALWAQQAQPDPVPVTQDPEPGEPPAPTYPVITFEDLPTTDYEGFDEPDNCIYVDRNRTALIEGNRTLTIYVENFCRDDRYMLFIGQLITSQQRRLVIQQPVLIGYRRQMEVQIDLSATLRPNEHTTHFRVTNRQLEEEDYYLSLMCARIDRESRALAAQGNPYPREAVFELRRRCNASIEAVRVVTQ